MEKILTSLRKIRFQDCDPFNHLNNSKYIDYFINAREDQLIEYYDIDIYALAFKEGSGWVVGSNQIAYLNPANTMEAVLIESQLIQYSAKQLTVEMRMWNQEHNQLKSFLWVNFVHYNLKEKKAASHSKQFLNLFENVVLPIEENSFEKRRRKLAIQYSKAV
ncbi:MAG: acyl-CoA thioesterase [Balneolaceae bacterium]|nr:acyl-CoA thioesterase [Balneolaceae bacterium]